MNKTKHILAIFIVLAVIATAAYVPSSETATSSTETGLIYSTHSIRRSHWLRSHLFSMFRATMSLQSALMPN